MYEDGANKQQQHRSVCAVNLSHHVTRCPVCENEPPDRAASTAGSILR